VSMRTTRPSESAAAHSGPRGAGMRRRTRRGGSTSADRHVTDRPAASAPSQGPPDTARHVIQRSLNPRFLSFQRSVNPWFSNLTASYDAAGNIWQAPPRPAHRRRRRPLPHPGS